MKQAIKLLLPANYNMLIGKSFHRIEVNAFAEFFRIASIAKAGYFRRRSQVEEVELRSARGGDLVMPAGVNSLD